MLAALGPTLQQLAVHVRNVSTGHDDRYADDLVPAIWRSCRKLESLEIVDLQYRPKTLVSHRVQISIATHAVCRILC